MSCFNPTEDISKKAKESLETLAESGSSEQFGVADILNTIAGNGEDQVEDKYLIGCAYKIMGIRTMLIKEKHGSEREACGFS